MFWIFMVIFRSHWLVSEWIQYLRTCWCCRIILYHQKYFNIYITLTFFTFFHIGQVASGLPGLKIPPMQTTIGNQTLNFTDMIAHVGSSMLALPLISILESIAVAKAFCKHFFLSLLNKQCIDITAIMLSAQGGTLFYEP